MENKNVIFEDLGLIHYKEAWDYQEKLKQNNLTIKLNRRKAEELKEAHFKKKSSLVSSNESHIHSAFHELPEEEKPGFQTTNHLLFCEHFPVYTLGKSGHIENVLISGNEMEKREIEFFRTNRGGDITFHGLQQIVGYPILDLENFFTDLSKYLFCLEEAIILTIAEYGITGARSKGETGVWIEPGHPGHERKICAMGIHCSRWITMHGFALNVNTDLSYFDDIIPCGILNKRATSIEKELGKKVDYEEVKEKVKKHFCSVFEATLI